MSEDFSRFTVPPLPYEGHVPRLDRKLLLLDLDSTLVLTYLRQPEGFTNDPKRWVVNMLEEADGTRIWYYTLIRPNAQAFVESCCQHYEVYFLTAAEQEYAEPLFAQLFPQVPPDHRLYRDSCVPRGGVYFKDLRALGFDLKRTILLDDNAPENTIPQSNGFYCAEFRPRECDDDGSPETIEELMQDQTLDRYRELLCSDVFLNSDDVRDPLGTFARIMEENLNAG